MHHKAIFSALMFACLLWAACGEEKKASSFEKGAAIQQLEDSSDAKSTLEVEPTNPNTTIQVSRDQTPYTGTLRYRAAWTDKAGHHLLLISGRHLEGKGEFNEGRREIFAYQYLKTGEAWNLEWKINDFVDGFGCDLAIDLPKEFVRFGDPDEDGILENAFVYTLDSRCDASVVPAKLMMHTRGKKLAIRGFAQLELGPPEEVMNQYRKEEGQPLLRYKAFDPAFEQVDERHKAFASELWDAFLAKKN